ERPLPVELAPAHQVRREQRRDREEQRDRDEGAGDSHSGLMVRSACAALTRTYRFSLSSFAFWRSVSSVSASRRAPLRAICARASMALMRTAGFGSFFSAS